MWRMGKRLGKKVETEGRKEKEIDAAAVVETPPPVNRPAKTAPLRRVSK